MKPPGRTRRRSMPAAALVVAMAAILLGAGTAHAAWPAVTAPGGLGRLAARSMTPGQAPIAAAQPSNSDTVHVSWQESTGGPTEGYEVRAYDADTGDPRVVDGTCVGLVTGTSCTDSNVPDGRWSYTITPRRGEWAGSESELSAPTWVDTVAPTVELQFPAAGGSYNQTTWDAGCTGGPGMCGTGDDVGSGLVSGGVTVLENATNLYWDGTAWSSSVPVLLPVTGGSPGFNVWSFPISNFVDDGSYTVQAVATDVVGNTTVDSATFTIDREGPPTAGGFPEAGGAYNTDLWNAGCEVPGFCGSDEIVPDIVSAEISILRNATGLYWDGTAFASATEVLHPITAPTGFAFPIEQFPADGFYTNHAVITDAASNTTEDTRQYRIDRAAPTLIPVFPEPGRSYANAEWDAGCIEAGFPWRTEPGPGMCGIALDDGPFSSATMSVRQVSTGLYWDGSAFASPTEVAHSVLGTGFLRFPATNFTADGQYAVHALVRDQAGNVSSFADSMTMDRAAPSVDMTFPVEGGTYSAATWNAGCSTPGLCGTTTDATSGVASTRVSIRRNATGLYWDGSAFASATETFVSVVTNEVLPFPAGSFPGDGSYTARAESRDFAGNLATDQATFTIDRSAPAVTAIATGNGDGLLDPGDTLSITFSEPLALNTICTTWSGTGDRSLTNATVTVTNSGSNDRISNVTSPTCTLRFGTYLSRADYAWSTSTFPSSTVQWIESTRTLRLTFGPWAAATWNPYTVPARTADYTPNALLADRLGNAVGTVTYPAPNMRF